MVKCIHCTLLLTRHKMQLMLLSDNPQLLLHATGGRLTSADAATRPDGDVEYSFDYDVRTPRPACRVCIAGLFIWLLL